MSKSILLVVRGTDGNGLVCHLVPSLPRLLIILYCIMFTFYYLANVSHNIETSVQRVLDDTIFTLYQLVFKVALSVLHC